MIKVLRLTYKDNVGAGKEIYADINEEVNHVEFTSKKHRPVVQSKALAAYEPWIQFAPQEYSEMMETLFNQMVDAWNEKYGKDKHD